MYRDHQLLGGFSHSQDAFSRIDDKILYSGAEAIARTDLEPARQAPSI